MLTEKTGLVLESHTSPKTQAGSGIGLLQIWLSFWKNLKRQMLISHSVWALGIWEWREPAPEWGRINQDRKGAHRPAWALCSFPWRHGLEAKDSSPWKNHVTTFSSLTFSLISACLCFLLHTVLYTGTLLSYLFPSVSILPLFTLGYIGLQKKKMVNGGNPNDLIIQSPCIYRTHTLKITTGLDFVPLI